MFVNESIVRKYKAELTEEVEPQILELIERAKKGVKALERKHHTMKTKVCAFIFVSYSLLYAHQCLCSQSEHVQVAKATTHRSVQARMDERKFRVLSGQRQNLERELLTLESQLKALVSHYILLNRLQLMAL